MDRKGYAEGFARRVKQFLTKRYDNPHAFSRGKEFPYSTLKKWQGGQYPIEDSLVIFAEKTGVSLDWLIFRAGDELREIRTRPRELAESLHAKVWSELKAAGFNQAEIHRLLPEASDLLEETVGRWIDQAKLDKKAHRQTFAKLSAEHAVTAFRLTIQRLRESGRDPQALLDSLPASPKETFTSAESSASSLAESS